MHDKLDSPAKLGNSIESSHYDNSPVGPMYLMSNKMVEIGEPTAITSTHYVDKGGTTSQSRATERTLSKIAVIRDTKPKSSSIPFRRTAPKISLH